jgi:fatty-acyl-CoA synthase
VVGQDDHIWIRPGLGGVAAFVLVRVDFPPTQPSLDERGYCRIQGRLKDMIIRGGENIYPREVEDVLFTHPVVANVAVVGLPDAEWGEIVAAFVQARPGTAPDSAALEAFCRRHLASHKVPRLWRFVSQFPQTASGKLQKFMLREQELQAERPWL